MPKPTQCALRAPLALAAACLAAGRLAPAAHAQNINYTDFSAASVAANPALTINADASLRNSELQLTPPNYEQAGSAFSTALIPLNQQESFSTEFSFQLSDSGGISDEDGPGADGIAFVLQTVGNNVGGAGIGIGYQGLSPSIGITFDTFNDNINFSNPPTDLDGNHVGIYEDGNIRYTQALAYQYAPTGGAPNFPTRFNNGQVWYAWIDYDGATQDMEVRYNSVNARPAAPFISAQNLNLASVLGQSSAFAGFTSGTGAAYNDQDILSWQFNNTFSPIGVPAVPEPAAPALLACGLPLAALALRRGRRV